MFSYSTWRSAFHSFFDSLRGQDFGFLGMAGFQSGAAEIGFKVLQQAENAAREHRLKRCGEDLRQPRRYDQGGGQRVSGKYKIILAEAYSQSHNLTSAGEESKWRVFQHRWHSNESM